MNWILTRYTIEFFGIWEEICNPDFNSPEFEGIKNAAGLNRLRIGWTVPISINQVNHETQIRKEYVTYPRHILQQRTMVCHKANVS